MEQWARSQPPYKTMFSLCCKQVVSLYNSKAPVNQTSLENICHFLTLTVYTNQTRVGVLDFQNLAPVDLAWWIDGFMTAVITIITIILNTISIIIFTSSSLRSPTNAILAMISALDVLTCVLRAPLLFYVYLHQGYYQLPSMAWCREYNYIHNFVPSALHSTAFLLNMGLSVQRCVGVGDIRRLRPICSYKGTIAIAVVSFLVSAFIHSLYPITYKITPVVALGKQMLASGKLEEVETCKLSARYPKRLESLSTSHAWARISALQLLPGVVMCVCNISLIAISYKTYSYRRRLIGAIGTIMNINRGFEDDQGNHKIMTTADEERRKISRDDGTEKADKEFQFSLQTEKQEFGQQSVAIVCSNGLEDKRPIIRKVESDSVGDFSSLQNYSQNCEKSEKNSEDELSDGEPNKVYKNNEIESPSLLSEERKVTHELDRILHESETDTTHTVFKTETTDCDVIIYADVLTDNNGNEDNIITVDEKISDVDIDVSDVQMNSSDDAEEEEENNGTDANNFSFINIEAISNSVTYPNEIYQHGVDRDNHPLTAEIEVPVLKNVSNTILNAGNLELLSTNTYDHRLLQNYPLTSTPLPNNNTATETEESRLYQSNNNIVITPHNKSHTDTSLLSAIISSDRKGSDISSIISSTIVEDTIISETLSDNNNTRISKDRNKSKLSPKRRGTGGSESSAAAELRPTIMLVLVTSCTLLAELLVTVAIFINFMNQVVDRYFVDQNDLVTFILVSNLITMISFPINFVFFSGLSRPFRNTLVAYTHFVMRKIYRK